MHIGQEKFANKWLGIFGGFLAMFLFLLVFYSCKGDSTEEINPGEGKYIKDFPNINVNERKISLLYIGSSFGVNTCIQFPFLANHFGIDINCAIMFKGAASLKFYADACDNDTPIFTFFYNNNGKFKNKYYTIDGILDKQDWDIVVVQRGGKEAAIWEDEQEEALKRLILYIKNHTKNKPTFLFNATHARSCDYFLNKRQDQINFTKQCMVTTRMASNVSGLKIIPSAIAIQNARNTYLANYGYFKGTIPDMAVDKSHLDMGIGSYVLGALMFETIIKPLFGLSIEGNDYIPNAGDLAAVGIWKDFEYTSPDNIENFFQIANEAAISAANNVWEMDSIMPFKYTMPGANPNEWDLNIDYSKTYLYKFDEDYEDIDPVVHE